MSDGGNSKNKIDVKSVTIRTLLEDQHFHIDYFQREFRWERKHIEALIEDLTQAFLKSYREGDKRGAVKGYQNYYLGTVVFSEDKDSVRLSIIDGQQRITSITLLLIYLKHWQGGNNSKIDRLIFSEDYGDKSFNMADESRKQCLKSLFEQGEYKVGENDNETVKNMAVRYGDISSFFSEDLRQEALPDKALPYFIDWFLNHVVMVKITADSDENAYIIFETMNDRGLNLTPTEMLKGYVLSKIDNTKQRSEIDSIWKREIQRLHSYGETTDQSFFRAWFRAKYAEGMRQGKAGSKDEDFELIGSRFHNWFKDKHEKLFNLEKSDDFFNFFEKEFPFYVESYLKIRDAYKEYDKSLQHLHYINYWGIAESLQDSLLLAPIKVEDDEKIIKDKLDYTARYIETFTVKRAVNSKRFAQSSIKYTMFNSVKLIRDNKISDLVSNLKGSLNKMEEREKETWDGVINLKLNSRNKKFCKHLLSRISSYLNELIGEELTYVSYHHPTQGKPFEIEHILGENFDEHKEEFESKNAFQDWRNSIGALILLPKGTNQSISNANYSEKLKLYAGQNAYAQTLTETCYKNNPNFLKRPEIKNLGFKPHPDFKKHDIEERRQLVKRICEQLWSTDYFIKLTGKNNGK